MQRIYEPENLMEGELLQQMLASEGIEAHLDHTEHAVGQVPQLFHAAQGAYELLEYERVAVGALYRPSALLG